jgi:tetratricopeptide (TPR) repeat protein
VIYRTGGNANNRSTVNGTVLDQTGQQTVVRRQSGSEQSIPTADVLELQFQRTATHEAADQLFEAGEYDEAIRSYLAAMGNEPRVWVRRMMVAQLVRAYTLQSQIDRAGRAFLELIQSDPTTHYFSSIPLAWGPSTASPSLQRQAEQWLAAEQEATASLIGASWLLSGSRRGDALERLRQLAADPDPRIAFLAQAQVWRTRTALADAAEVDRWETIVRRMPSELRGGPYYVLGKGLSAVSRHQQAALAFLRVPILYKPQRDLVPWALLSAGRELERIEQADGAVTLYQEILRQHADHPAAAEANALLERFSDERNQ